VGLLGLPVLDARTETICDLHSDGYTEVHHSNLVERIEHGVGPICDDLHHKLPNEPLANEQHPERKHRQRSERILDKKDWERKDQAEG
jgi:hypothetical protein